MQKKIYPVILTLAACLLISSGCQNGNLFGRFHKKGSTGDVPTLLTDAKSAMANHEYNNAQAYFKKIIDQQPGNSEALLGYAQASLPTAGLDLGTIISNIIRSQSGAPASVSEYNGISGVLSAANGTSTIGTDDILSGLESKIDSLKEVVGLTGSGENVISALEKIVKGQADGAIPSDDPTVNINLSIAYILRAVLRVSDFLHISASGFDVTIPQTISSTECDLATETIRDVKRAYHRAKAVAVKLNVSSTSTIKQMESDISKMLLGTSDTDTTSLKSQLSAKGCNPSTTDLDILVDPLNPQ